VKLAQLLFSQGFGARRECEGLILGGHVTLAGRVCDDPWHEVDPNGLEFGVRGQTWPYHERALIVMNKPAGHECSRKPRHHPSLYSLLPAPLLRRNVQAVGRLDEDTTGVLLLTDDGALIHRLTSPKHHVPKVYEVVCKHAVDPQQLARLLEGVTLDDAPDERVRAAACEATGERTLRLTLTEGKYHQVKRMLAAVGNRVEALHRSAFGALTLPADLAPGQWRWLDGPQVLEAAPAIQGEARVPAVRQT
jgi:16S rRNA pseudouridine516 synthase